MRDAFVRTLIDIAKEDKNVHLITGDLGFGVLKPFWEQLPDQFTNAGIAEQNMTSFAAGLALEGKTVFTYSIGNFPTLRCLEQIRNDCAYHNANVKIVCVGGGFVYGSLGMSHHATEDLAIMRALPDVTVLAPGDLVEAECATRAIYEHQGTCYLRLGRGGEKRIHEKIDTFRLGKQSR
jgi:transketolase